jgi:hypothetical protein
VPYDQDVRRALEDLRRREFEAGRYYPVVRLMYSADPYLSFVHPGPRHSSAAQAVAEAGELGTRSILDIHDVTPEPAVGAAAPLGERTLREVFDSPRPSRTTVEEHVAELLEDIGPGQCGYLVVYDGDAPSELFFVGCPCQP